MRALVFHAPGDLRLEERPDLQPNADDAVVVRPRLAGVCGTDRSIVGGRYRARRGIVLGHEAVGVVMATAVGVLQPRPGDRVVLNPTGFCGCCPACQRGHTNRCVEKERLELGVGRDGAFADAVCVPGRLVQGVPADVPDERAVFTEPLTCVLEAARRAALAPDDRVVVVGGGPLGLLWALHAGALGCIVVVVERDPFRLAAGIAVADVRRPEEIDGLQGSSLVVDTTGHGLELALRVVGNDGRVVLMGCDPTASCTLSPFELTNRGVSVFGSADYDAGLFPTGLARARDLPCERLLTAVLPLEQHDEGFRSLAVGDHEAPYTALKLAFAP